MTDQPKIPKRPEGWTDEEWEEYLEWHNSLPEWIDGPNVIHAVIIGKQSPPKPKRGSPKAPPSH